MSKKTKKKTNNNSFKNDDNFKFYFSVSVASDMTLFNKFVLICKNNNLKYQINMYGRDPGYDFSLLFYENIDVVRKLKEKCKDEKIKTGGIFSGIAFNIPKNLLKERGIKL